MASAVAVFPTPGGPLFGVSAHEFKSEFGEKKNNEAILQEDDDSSSFPYDNVFEVGFISWTNAALCERHDDLFLLSRDG